MQNQETLVHVFWERVKNTPDRPAILHKINERYLPVIWREHGKAVEMAAHGLLKRNIKNLDKIAIVSQSRPHWTWADIAILSTAAVSVPIYPTLNGQEIVYLLKHSEAVGAFIENVRQLDKILQADELPKNLRFIVVFDGEPTTSKYNNVDILKWEDLLKDGEVYLPNHPNELSDRIKELDGNTLATIVYTSGTTGIPKGAMLIHSNLHYVCQTLSLNVGFHPDDISLSFLPLSHIFERIGGQFLSIYEGLVMAFAESMETVPQNMVEIKPTIMNAVPRFYEKAYHRIIAEIRKMPKPQQYLIRWALSLSRRAHKLKEAQENGSDLVENIYKTELRVADRIVFSKIRNRFGGRLRFLVSGAAPLSLEVSQFFETIGMPILEGYGLTETTAPVACNKPNDNKRGTVGRPLPGLDVKIAEDGEIMVKGPSVFIGYYKNDAATTEAFKDGWFLTGDIGEIDKDGYLTIKDRKKDIIITAGGKHIAPQYIENLFVGDKLISRVLAYGDRRKYITALLTLSQEGLSAYAKAHQISYSSPEELVHHPKIIQEVQNTVNEKNKRLASFEQIKQFIILENDFSIEANELTPTLKLKRRSITEKYKNQLDGLYEAEEVRVES